MYNPGYGWGYGSNLGYVSQPAQTAVRSAPTSSALKQYKTPTQSSEGGKTNPNQGRAASGPADPNVSMALGGVVAAMLGISPLAGMRAGKHAAHSVNEGRMSRGHDGYNAMTAAGFDSIAAHNMATEEMDNPTLGKSFAQNNIGGPANTTQTPGGIETVGDNAGHDSQSNCFITTATAHHFGWADDCQPLTVLRWFRDNVLAKSYEGMRDIQTYYRDAPSIAKAMTGEDCSYVWDTYLKKSLSAIVAGKYDRAYRIYKAMFNHLTEQRD